MNNSPNRLRKKGLKKIRETSRDDYIPEDTAVKPKKILDREPHRDLSHQKKAVFEERKSQLSSFRERMKQKKSKSKGKVKRSRLQNPDEVDFPTEPESIHMEGQKWMQNIRSQTLDKANKLRKKLQGYFGKTRG